MGSPDGDPEDLITTKYGYAMSFVDYSYSDPDHHDIRGFHSYHNYRRMPDYRELYREKMGDVPKPLWGTEVGFHAFGGEAGLSETGLSYWLFKKYILCFAEGVEWINFNPLSYFPGFRGLYHAWFRLAFHPDPLIADLLMAHPSRWTDGLLARKFAHPETLHLMDKHIIGNIELYLFASQDSTSLLAAGWCDPCDDRDNRQGEVKPESLDVRSVLEIAHPEEVWVYDVSGDSTRLTESGILAFTESRFLLSWSVGTHVGNGSGFNGGSLHHPFSLDHNYPNPFDPSTVIGFRIGSPEGPRH